MQLQSNTSPDSCFILTFSHLPHINFHPPAPTHAPFSAYSSKQQTLADSGGSDGALSTELNQLAYLLWGHAVFAGLLGSEGITVSPRATKQAAAHAAASAWIWLKPETNELSL